PRRPAGAGSRSTSGRRRAAGAQPPAACAARLPLSVPSGDLLSGMPTGAITITPPADFVLPRDYCSYGYFHLAPHRWDAGAGAVMTAQELADGPALVRVTQPAGRGARGGGDARANGALAGLA